MFRGTILRIPVTYVEEDVGQSSKKKCCLYTHMQKLFVTLVVDGARYTLEKKKMYFVSDSLKPFVLNIWSSP